MVEYYNNIFTSLGGTIVDTDLIKDSILNLINLETNQMLTWIPSHAEIKEVFFKMNKEGAPSPDVFGALFFQCYRDIIR